MAHTTGGGEFETSRGHSGVSQRSVDVVWFCRLWFQDCLQTPKDFSDNNKEKEGGGVGSEKGAKERGRQEKRRGSLLFVFISWHRTFSRSEMSSCANSLCLEVRKKGGVQGGWGPGKQEELAGAPGELILHHWEPDTVQTKAARPPGMSLSLSGPRGLMGEQISCAPGRSRLVISWWGEDVVRVTLAQAKNKRFCTPWKLHSPPSFPSVTDFCLFIFFLIVNILMGLKTLFYLEQGSILLYSLVTLFPLISIQTPCFCPHLTFP